MPVSLVRRVMTGLLAFSLFAGILFSTVAEEIALDHIVAIANDDVITRAQLDARMKSIRTQLEQRGTALPADNILERQVLERLIIEKLQLQLAKRNGIRVDDETLNQGLRSVAKQNGLTLDQFRKTLEKDGYGYARFREEFRREMTIQRLQQQLVENRTQVTDREIENELENQRSQAASRDEYHLGHILIAVPEAASAEDIADAKGKAENTVKALRDGADFSRLAIEVSSGQKALEGGDLGWRKADQLPTLFSGIITNMNPGDISEPVRSPGGFHIIKLIDKRGTTRKVVRQAHVRQIELHPDTLKSDADIQRQLTQLRERLLNGEDFAALARARSENIETAANGGDMGWVSPNGLEPGFAKVVGQLQTGEISTPFRTPSGWHIVEVQAWRDYDSTDEYQRARARQVIAKRKTNEQLGVWLRRIRDEAYVEIRLDEE